MLLSIPWGIASLVDVYVGFILFSGWIVYREESLVRPVIWVVLMMVLGFSTASPYAFIALQTSDGDWRRFWVGRRCSELHAVWSILTQGKRGYAHHPEVLRWKGKLKALYQKHEEIVAEMLERGYRHSSPLDPSLATGAERQHDFVDSYQEQIRILRAKGCDCDV